MLLRRTEDFHSVLGELYMPEIPPLWPSGGLLVVAPAASSGYFLMQLRWEIALFPFHTYV